MIIVYVLIFLIALCFAVLYIAGDEEIKPTKEPNISKRISKAEVPPLIDKSHTINFKHGKPTGVTKNGEVYCDNGEIYIINNNKPIKIGGADFGGNCVIDPNRTINFIPPKISINNNTGRLI